MDIIPLKPFMMKLAAQVFGRAFFDYPMSQHYLPDPAKRKQTLEWFLGCSVAYTLRYGRVYTTPDVTGLACWLPPGHKEFSHWGFIITGCLFNPAILRFRQYGVVRACEDTVDGVHKKLLPEPHWYLWALAVDPGRQGKGIGAQLTRAGLALADADGLPCYLETHLEKNVVFYRRFGFEVASDEIIPGQGLRFWTMIRPAGKVEKM